jgi:hypothetical protein
VFPHDFFQKQKKCKIDSIIYKKMLRRSFSRFHGILQLNVGNGSLPIDGEYVVPMTPSNHIFHDPVALRQQLDQDGYIYLKNLVPRESIRGAYVDVCRQLEKNNWWSKEVEDELLQRDGFTFGAASPPAGTILPTPVTPFHITEKVSKACFGPSIVASVRHLFGGGAECMNFNSLDLSFSGERHGFYMPSVYMNQGTKLVLTCWVALHDMPFNVGGIVCSKGSNSSPAFAKVRETYGAHEVETGDICGDGTLTWDPADVWNLGGGECPLATSSFEPGDVVFTTVYTMQSFSTNLSKQWRLSAQSRWVMHGDDIGCDPRFKSFSSAEEEQKQQAVQLSRWMAHRDDTQRYPRTMLEARKAWGIPPLN